MSSKEKDREQRRPRIVHLISGLGRGGAEINLSRRLPLLAGWDHKVIFIHDGPIRARIEEQGIACRQVRGILRKTDPSLVVRMMSALAEEKPDLVISHLWLACVLGRIFRRLHGTPLVSVLHQDAGFDGPLRRTISRAVGFPDDRIVAVSEPVAAAARRTFPRLAGRIQVIPNGIDVEALRAEVQVHGLDRSRLGIGDDEFVALGIGRFDPVKNFSLLIEAMALLKQERPRIRLVLVGTGEQESQLRRRAGDLGLGDQVLFEANQPAVPYLSVADVFVQPSATEGLSNALLEAMAAGLAALVTSPPGGHPVVRDGETGVVITPDPAAIAAGLLRMRDRPEVRSRIGASGSAHVTARFPVAASARAYDTLFREVLGLVPPFGLSPIASVR